MERKATREGYGDALLALGRERDDVVVLDADLSGSTKTNKFAEAFPARFFNVGVAEQNLVGVAAGLALSGLTPFASSFAMFLAGRAWEIVRNSVAYPGLNVKLVASHAGLTVGEDGASHQIIEDISLMRTIPGMRVFVPSDYQETVQIVHHVAANQGPYYVRCGRANVPMLARPGSYQFAAGRGELRRKGDEVTIIACGVMVHEADLAAEALSREGIEATVVNMASIKPIDSALIKKLAIQTGCMVTAEEHNVIGGLGSAVAEVLAEEHPVPLARIGVKDIFGQSGTSDELLDAYGLRAKDIVAAARGVILRKKSGQSTPKKTPKKAKVRAPKGNGQKPAPAPKTKGPKKAPSRLGRAPKKG